MTLFQPLAVSVILILILQHLTRAYLLLSLNVLLLLHHFLGGAHDLRAIDAEPFCLLVLVEGTGVSDTLRFVVARYLCLVHQPNALRPLLNFSFPAAFLDRVINASHLLCFLLLFIDFCLLQIMVNFALEGI